MNIEEMLNEVRLLEDASKIDLSTVNYKVRVGIESQKNQAIQDLPAVKAKYGKALSERSVGFFLGGDPGTVTKFAQIMEEEGGVVLDNDEVYEFFAKQTEALLSNKRLFAYSDYGNYLNILNFGLRDLQLDPNITPVFKTEVTLHTYQDVLDWVKSNIREATGGDDFNKDFLRNKFVDICLKLNVSQKNVPVVIVNCSENEYGTVKNLFNTSNVVVLSKEDKVDKDFVVNTLKRNRPKLTKKEVE